MTIRSGLVIRFWIFLFLVSCGPSTLSDLRYEGEAQTKRLAEELRRIETREDLQKALPLLKKRFTRIADLLLQMRSFPKEACPQQLCEPSLASEQLFAELARLYEIPGGRELIESAQEEGLARLRDDF